jgi:DNA-directed RNA polymerase specialized sigma24 family protein
MDQQGKTSYPTCIARRYGRLVAWLDARELEQEAAVAMLEAQRTWRAGGGANLATYQTRAVVFRLKRFVDRERSPVSASTNYVPNLRGLVRADVRAIDDEIAPHTTLRIEDHLDLQRAADELRAIMAMQSDGAREVLLGETKPAQVAHDLGLPVATVYRQTQAARLALTESPRLRALMVSDVP